MTDALHDEIYKLLNEKFHLSKKDTGSYAAIKYPKFLPSFRFQMESYEVEGLGFLFLMKGKGMRGQLSFLTAALSPKEGIGLFPALLNVMDLGHSKMTVTMEYFDVGVGMSKALKKVAEDHKDILDAEENAHWYRKKRLPGSFAKVCTKFGKDNVMDLVLLSLKAYLEEDRSKLVSTSKAKKDLTSRMVKEGSLIPEMVLKALGEESYKVFLDTLVMPS